MGDITVVKRLSISGLDADKPSTANIGDEYSATDTNVKYYWDGSAWVQFSDIVWEQRRVTTPDFSVGDFTLDNSFKVDGLDLSSILPVGVITAHIRTLARTTTDNKGFFLRTNGTDDVNTIILRTQVANIIISSNDLIAIDSDRLLDYKGEVATWSTLSVSVLGWFTRK